MPNLISGLRLLSAIPVFYLYKAGQFADLLMLLSIVFISDLVDGQIARKFNVTTKLGKVLDMLSDNVIINLLLVLFAIFPLNSPGFSITFVYLSLLRLIVTISWALAAFYYRNMNYKTGYFGQVNAFAMMYFMFVYILSGTTPQFAHYYDFSRYALYALILSRLVHLFYMLNKGDKT